MAGGRWWWMLLCLAGCGRVGFDEVARSDSQPGDAFSGVFGPWSTPQAVAELDIGGADDDPTLPADELEVYFNANNDIYVASRASTSMPFGTPTLVPVISTTGDETSPRISADGLRLYFGCVCSDTIGNNDVYVSTRASRMDAWPARVHLTALSTIDDDEGAAESPDGLTLVLNSGVANVTDKLYVSTRASIADPWPPPAPISELDLAAEESSPFLTAWGEIVFSEGIDFGNLDLYDARRPAPGMPFGAATRIEELRSATTDDDAWISADGRRMYFSSTRFDGVTLKIYTSMRSPL